MPMHKAVSPLGMNCGSLGIRKLAPIDCIAVDMDHAAEQITNAVGYDLIIIDTPNAVQAYRDQFVALIGLADFVLIPTGATFDDRRSTIPWMGVMKHHGKEAAFVMNRVKRSTVASARRRSFC